MHTLDVYTHAYTHTLIFNIDKSLKPRDWVRSPKEGVEGEESLSSALGWGEDEPGKKQRRMVSVAGDVREESVPRRRRTVSKLQRGWVG